MVRDMARDERLVEFPMTDSSIGNVAPLVVRQPLPPAAPIQVARQATLRPAGTPVQVSVPHTQLTIDPSSDRVLQEYFNAAGTLTNLAPSRTQLQAYRLAALSSEGAALKPESRVSKA